MPTLRCRAVAALRAPRGWRHSSAWAEGRRGAGPDGSQLSSLPNQAFNDRFPTPGEAKGQNRREGKPAHYPAAVTKPAAGPPAGSSPGLRHLRERAPLLATSAALGFIFPRPHILLSSRRSPAGAAPPLRLPQPPAPRLPPARRSTARPPPPFTSRPLATLLLPAGPGRASAFRGPRAPAVTRALPTVRRVRTQPRPGGREGGKAPPSGVRGAQSAVGRKGKRDRREGGKSVQGVLPHLRGGWVPPSHGKRRCDFPHGTEGVAAAGRAPPPPPGPKCVEVDVSMAASGGRVLVHVAQSPYLSF